MPRTNKPDSLTLRCYNVGFGDCFLLTFHYGEDDRHVLIDFGSTKAPKAGHTLLEVAQDIDAVCGGKLHAVVATHRHRDHISGFATDGPGDSGDIIRRLKPELVLQPWTEHPDAHPDAVSLSDVKRGDERKGFLATLNNMHVLSAAILDQARNPAIPLSQNVRAELRFLGDDNLKNASAVKNLMTMQKGQRRRYLAFGDDPGLREVLPGVTVKVLGPPTVEQSKEIRKQRAKDPDEFWHLASFWQFQAQAFAMNGAAVPVFPAARTASRASAPIHTRWFLEHLKRIRGEQMLSIVRALDSAMNNTSLVLLFMAGGKKLLFPGDAQIENWSYALSKPAVRELLKDVNLYKVGHHGSLNATPKTLWNLFSHRSENQGNTRRLKTVVSTLSGVHGTPARGTEVPRKTLVEALKGESNYFSTQELKKKDGLCKVIQMKV